MTTILDNQANLKLRAAIQSARDALEITDTINNVLPNEGLDIASEYIISVLDILSELSNERWASANWVTRRKYKQILKEAERE